MEDVARKGRTFTVGVPSEALDFWRAVRNDPPQENDLAPDRDVRDRFPTEDHCSYRGFSAWRDERMARDTARDVLNPLLIAQGEVPFTHIFHFRVWPKRRHACARLGPEDHHWGIWGAGGGSPRALKVRRGFLDR
jgi:hypothetical protein